MKYQCLYIWQKLARIRIPTSMGLSGKMTNKCQKSNHRSQDARQIDWDKVCKREQKATWSPFVYKILESEIVVIMVDYALHNPVPCPC